MSMVGFIKFMKWTLVLFNVLILCAGAIAIGLGSWGLASEYGAEKLKDITGSELYKGAAIAIIVGGCVMVVIAFLGAVGAVLEHRILLGIYFFITLLLLILFVVAASVGYAYRDIVAEKITKEMEATLVNKYGINTNMNDENNDVTNVWDDLQTNLQCCGVKGRTPGSLKSWYIWQSSKWFNVSGKPAEQYVPKSCCRENVNFTLCIKLNSDPTKPVQLSPYGVSHESEYVYDRGCYDQLLDELMEHILAIAGIAIAIIVIMFLCLLFSMCVCTHAESQSLVI